MARARGAPPYVISTPSAILYARGKQNALEKARDLVGAMPNARESTLEARFGVVIMRTSEEHAKRHGI